MANLRRTWRRVILVVLFLGVLTLAAHAAFFTNRQLLDYTYRQVSYQLLADHIPSQQTQEATAVAVFDRVHEILFAPGGMPIYDDSPWEILSRGYGFCDQQIFLLAAILEKKGIPARMLYLHDAKKEEVHAVLEVEANDRWVVLDPTNGFVPRNAQGQISTFDELCTDQDTLSRTVKGKAIDRYIPPEIFNSTGENAYFCFPPRRLQIYGEDRDFKRKAINFFLNVHQKMFGTFYADLFQDLYLFRQDAGEEQQYLKARQLQLYGRLEDAAAAFDTVLQTYPQGNFTQDVLVFSGMLECERGKFTKGEMRLHQAMNQSSASGIDWHMLAAYSLGMCAEAQGDMDKAKYYYNLTKNIYELEGVVGLMRLENMPKNTSHR